MINGTAWQHLSVRTTHISKAYQYFRFSKVASIIIRVPSEILYIGLEFPLTEMKT